MEATRRPHFDSLRSAVPPIQIPILGKAWKQATPLTLTIAGLFLAIVIGVIVFLVTASGGAAVRFAGMTLQLLGLFAVAYGLRQTRLLFRKPGTVSKFQKFFITLVSAFKRPEPSIFSVSSTSFATFGGETRAYVVPGPSFENRLSALEVNLELLRNEIDTKNAVFNQELSKIKESFETENRDLTSRIEQAAKATEELGSGGLHIEWMGLIWLFIGVILTSIPDEIARAF
jgi:hypothetical protein